jgi:transposase
MEGGYECGCGLDVHAKTVGACVSKHGRKELRTFGTMTEELLPLGDWWTSEGCPPVAIESTGVDWKPVYNLLAGRVEVILVNARHIKAVAGRKTEVRDCEWVADLVRQGLLRASFMSPREIRELRELTRDRQTWRREHTAVATRLQKLLESGHRKWGQVASDVLGLRGRLMGHAVAPGEQEARQLAALAQGKLKNKHAVGGRLTQVQGWVLGELLARVEELEAAIQRVETRIGEEGEQCSDPFVKEAVVVLDSMPGIGEHGARTIVSESGVDMARFPSAAHLASWAGLCPGNNESAGTRNSGQTTKGSQSLRTALVEAAWAATRAKGTFLAAKS